MSQGARGPIRRGLKWFAAAAVLLAMAVWLFDSPLGGLLPNVGLPMGYYGKLNRVKTRLRSLPNVAMLGVRTNHDITLEDFTFDLRIDGKYDASLYFREAPNSSTWELFDEADDLALRRRREGPFTTWSTTHDWWAFDLEAGNDLERAVVGKIRNGHDVLRDFSRVMELVQSTPPAALGEPAHGKVLYLSIACPDDG